MVPMIGRRYEDIGRKGLNDSAGLRPADYKIEVFLLVKLEIPHLVIDAESYQPLGRVFTQHAVDCMFKEALDLLGVPDWLKKALFDSVCLGGSRHWGK